MKNRCSRVCTKYRCVHLNHDDLCEYRLGPCHVFVTEDGIECGFHHNDQACRYYYWCQLDFMSGLDSPVESELSNGVVKQYGHEL